jgi:hypothetical protein
VCKGTFKERALFENTNAYPHARKKLNRSARKTKKAKKKMKTKVRRRKKHRTEKKPLQEYTTVDESSSEEESDDERGGMYDRQEDLRRIIPRQWPRTKLEFEQVLLAARNSAKDAGAPVWALKNLKVLGAIATHLHASNKGELKKNDRPHPAAECFFVHYARAFLRAVHGERAEATFEEEIAKLERTPDPSATGPILKAIARAKNVKVW